ncbi:MAG: hypothetical protein AAFN74_08435, partial [Myxococcota bacterium]
MLSPELAILPVKTLNIAPTGVLRIVGSRGAAFYVEGLARIEGTINADASEIRSEFIVDPSCAVLARAGDPGARPDPTPHGGAGGGHVSTGGLGSDGTRGGQAVNGVLNAEPLYGGCPGGAGHTPGDPCLLDDTQTCRAPGGGGGGAVQISAAAVELINATITANGGGGSGGIMGGYSYNGVPFPGGG